MGRKRGNTLLEALFALLILTIIIQGISVMLRQINRTTINYHNDIAYCLTSLAKDISMANEVFVEDDQIILYETDNISTISLNEERIVKTPGFNIYLHHVDNLLFYHDEDFVYCTMKRGDTYGTYKIGVYFRPSFRVCESDCDNPTTSDDFNDTSDDPIIE